MSAKGRVGVAFPAQAYLEMAKGPTPAAALFTVDAADRQAQHLYLQLWVWVDLWTGMWGNWSGSAPATVPGAYPLHSQTAQSTLKPAPPFLELYSLSIQGRWAQQVLYAPNWVPGFSTCLHMTLPF